MALDAASEALLAPLREAVKVQGDLVRSLKSSSAPELDVKRAVAELKTRKKKLEDKELSLHPAEDKFDRGKMEDTLKRRFFYDQSFAIYGGVTGQFDFGPMGCAMKANLLTAWRKFFVLEEQMLEVDCTVLTPEPVLKASGHVERFADLMVKDLKNGECFRLDHLIKSHLEKIITDKKTDNETKDECNDIIVKLDGMNGEEMGKVMNKFSIKSPITGNDLTDPIEFNLMFQTNIGPTGTIKGFLRPETAQGIFVNFKRLLEFNQGKLPFASAQIGNSFRNEISPRSGLIRVREFTMAEIEHFCDPKNKNHPKFEKVKNEKLLLYSACAQMEGRPATTITIGEAVEGAGGEHFGDLSSESHLKALNSYLADRSYIEEYEASVSDKVVLEAVSEKFSQGELEKLDHVSRWVHHINTYQFSPGPRESLQEITKRLFASANEQRGLVANQTLGYFMARIQQFLVKMGVDPARLRFRQHMNNEMAHYACDCWDAELLTSYGWVECVGCADRSAYDLTQHTKTTNVKLAAVKQLEKSVTKNVIEVVPNKQPIGKGFKKDAKIVMDALSTMEEDDIAEMETNFKKDGNHALTVDNRSFTISPAMVSVKKYQKKVDVEDLIPAVIEPSFGIGRIMYSILEHNFKVRDGDEQRTYFSLPPVIAPVKCSVLPLSTNADFTELVQNISQDLRENDISHKVDDSSGSIGKRYARTDEVAIPFGITVDFDSLKTPNTVTLRERDSTLQVRIPVDDIGDIVRNLSLGKMTWNETLIKFPRFQQQENKS